MDALWQRVSSRVRDELGQVGFETWINPLNFVGMEGRTATIQAPNKFFRDWVNERYLEILRESLSAEVGMSVNIALVVKDQNGNGHGNGSNGHHQASASRPPVRSIRSHR